MKLAWKNWFNHISPPPGSGWVPSTSMTLICALLQLALKKGFYLTHKFRYQIKSRTYFFFAISLSSLLAASRLQFLRKFGNVIDWVTSCVEFSHDKCFIRLFRRRFGGKTIIRRNISMISWNAANLLVPISKCL